MRKILIIILVIVNCQFLIVNSFAQSISRSTISSAGGTLTGGSNIISFNIGEAVISTLSVGSNIITQGFEQPGEELHMGTVATSVCAGSSIIIPYSAIDIGAGNSFTAQLSNATGSFTAPVNIGTQAGNASGIINVIIPANSLAGTGYRIRLVSSFPVVAGTDNGADITIHSVLVTINSIINNTCHGGSNGSVTAAATISGSPAYSFTIAGPTVNTTGATSGIFTGLSAGIYTITLQTEDGCSSTTTATITEPAGTLPDISLGSDYSSNIFIIPGVENSIVYNISEIAGNAATGDTIRIIKPSGYSFTFDGAATSVDIGSTTYTLDNSHWKMDNSNPVFISLILDPFHDNIAGTVNCGEKVFVLLKLKRNTPNLSTFSLSARLRRANGESNILNNLSSIVFTAE